MTDILKNLGMRRRSHNHMGRLIFILAAMLSLLIQGPAIAADAAPLPLIQQRQNFLAAETALQQGAMASFRKLQQYLANYPLRTYLQYQYLRRRLHTVPADKIQKFLNINAGTPLAAKLQRAWLRTLALQGRWQQLITAYRPTDHISSQCSYRQALLHTGDSALALHGIEDLWRVGHSQPRSCDPVFKAWRKSGGITPTLAWQRFQLAMLNNKTRLARYLRRFMPANDRYWATLWLQVRHRPTLIQSKTPFVNRHPMRHTILLYGLRKMANRRPHQAINFWEETLSRRYHFSVIEQAIAKRDLAMALAIRGQPEALARLADLHEEADDLSLREWRVRAALGQQNWYAVLAWIGQLTAAQQAQSRWRYWQARALEVLQQKQQAKDIYLSLASQRSYYGLLSADRLALPYRIITKRPSIQPLSSVKLEDYPGLARARELFKLGRLADARREWYYATHDMAEWQLSSAAHLAQRWGWYDRAIMTVARTHQRDDLTLRFPLPYRQQIFKLAADYQVDPALVFAIIRQESAFTADVRSPAGALGLMQLLPRTARQVAKRLEISLPHQRTLLNIATNLRLGIAHLQAILQHFDHHELLASAAYNAGQYRVNRWLPRSNIMPADIWVENVPIKETRRYIQHIMLFTAIYDRRLGRQATPLSQRMPPVSPSLIVLAADKAAGL